VGHISFYENTSRRCTEEAANRLGANSLLDTVVFGRRAGRSAADFSKSRSQPNISPHAVETDRQLVQAILQRTGQGTRTAALRLEMGTTMNRYVSVFREQEGLETARQHIQRLMAQWQGITIQDKGKTFNTGVIAALELGFMLDCAEAIITGALTREESRGAHFRTDYIDRNDEEWLKHILLYHQVKGEPHMNTLPVQITRWKPKIRLY